MPAWRHNMAVAVDIDKSAVVKQIIGAKPKAALLKELAEYL